MLTTLSFISAGYSLPSRAEISRKNFVFLSRQVFRVLSLLPLTSSLLSAEKLIKGHAGNQSTVRGKADMVEPLLMPKQSGHSLCVKSGIPKIDCAVIACRDKIIHNPIIHGGSLHYRLIK